MSTTQPFTPDRIAEVDVSGQVKEVTGLPDHLRDALWRVESAALKPQNSPGGLIVAGMGGAAIGGLMARTILGDRAIRPITVPRNYELPTWATPDSTVLCLSYSGLTEETLAVYSAAQALGANTIVATTGGKLAEQARADGVPVIPIPGGFESRAAIGYFTVIALEVAALCGAGESVRAEVDVAAGSLAQLVEEWGPDSSDDSQAKALARALHGTIPMISGADVTSQIAYRWKTQLNTNSKIPAFASELPELDHNEIVGWEGATALGRFSAVFLDDSDLHPRVRQRIELSRAHIATRGGTVFRIESTGNTRLERVLSLVLLGDLVSLYMAILGSVDPRPTEAIDSIKGALAGG